MRINEHLELRRTYASKRGAWIAKRERLSHQALTSSFRLWCRNWIIGLLVLVVLVRFSPLQAQDTKGPVLTNGVVETEDTSASDASQTSEGVQDQDASGTNVVADTNQVTGPGPDGRTRRLIRRAQRRPRNNAQANAAGPSATSTNSGAGALDYSAFRLVVDRNIFDPNRFPHSSRPAVQPKTVDAFTLVGTMSYEKGIFAFFDGSSSDYKKVVKPEETIAGYKVVAIAPDSVKLALNTNVLELSVGTQMRRREDGSWDRSASSETYAASTSSSSNSSSNDPASSGAESETIKKMMLRREKE